MNPCCDRDRRANQLGSAASSHIAVYGLRKVRLLACPTASRIPLMRLALITSRPRSHSARRLVNQRAPVISGRRGTKRYLNKQHGDRRRCLTRLLRPARLS